MGAALLVMALLFVGFNWIKNNMLSIDPGSGSPVGLALRTDHHIAQLIQTLEPYVPSPNRDHSMDTYRLSMLLVPLDGSRSRVVKIKGGLRPASYSLAKVRGTDGDRLWFDAAGVGAIDLKNFKLVPPSDLGAPPNFQSGSTSPFGPKVEHHLAAGMFISNTEWLGVHSLAEVERDFRPGSYLRRVVRADNSKQPRRLHLGRVDAESFAGRQRIESMVQLEETDYLNAALIRSDDNSEPIRLSDPDGALMIFTSDPGLKGTLSAARTGTDGVVRWRTDTGIDRFTLSQILPGAASTAFIGTRPSVPGNVSEPLLVIVDHSNGSAKTHSLWVR